MNDVRNTTEDVQNRTFVLEGRTDDLDNRVNTAQGKADNAYDRAIEAKNDAMNALNEAGLKARVYYEGAPPGNPHDGDVWIDTSNNYHPWVFRNGGWQDASVLQADVIQAVHVAASAILAEHIAAGAITAEKIGAGEIKAVHLDVQKLDAITADLGYVTAGTLAGPERWIQLGGGEFLRANKNGAGMFIVDANGATWTRDLYVWGKWCARRFKNNCLEYFYGFKKIDGDYED